MPDPRLAPLAAPERFTAIAGYDLFDAGLRQRLDRVCEHTAGSTGMPMALVSVVLADAQFFAGVHGLDSWMATRGIPIEWAFCGYALASGEPSYVVADATRHPVHRTSPIVVEHGVRSYVGVPVWGHDGHGLGMHCVASDRPARYAHDMVGVLRAAAVKVSEILDGYRLRSGGHPGGVVEAQSAARR